jgi:hypothetical protein
LALIELDGVLVTEVECVADQGVAYRNFFKAGDVASEVFKVFEVEVVTGVKAKAELACADGGCAIGGDCFFGVGGIFAGVAFGVEFDAVGAGFRCPFNHGDDGIDEERDADAGVFETPDGLTEVVFMADGVPAVVGSDLAKRVGDEGHLARAYGEYEVDEFLFLGIAFDVKFGGDDLLNVVDVGVADVAFVGSWVNGYAVGAESLRVYGGFYYVGVIASAAIAKGAEFVDVYGEPRHGAKVNKR